MKRLLLFMASLVMLFNPLEVFGQDKLEANISADLVSTYIWRGQKLGNASVQPGLGLSYKGLSFGAWGSVSLTDHDEVDKNTELDLTLSYSTSGLTLGVTDYYISDDGKYFEYASGKTFHVFEAHVGYDFSVLSLDWYTNFAGADGVNKDGKRAYSSYFEVGVPFRLCGLDWKFVGGAVPYATTSYSKATGFAVTNLTLGTSVPLRITDRFSLPLSASVTANPSDQKFYLVAGISL